ncbi:MAG: hypothetical protein GX944_00970 [Alphaproteobacteria bacterium]|jgi:PBP1b-binding outer membrane lipoprotein LpoB|nr:hypothetical protein [Alphaproteobacteria bacterium]
MKKIILSIAAVAVLYGCSSSYTHYEKNEIYTQDGFDCIVETGEKGVMDRANTDKTNSVIYPNTACSELLNKKPETPAAPTINKVVFVKQPTSTTVRSVKRVYLRNNCAKASYGTWCE